jgi:hypothetical protein
VIHTHLSEPCQLSKPSSEPCQPMIPPLSEPCQPVIPSRQASCILPCLMPGTKLAQSGKQNAPRARPERAQSAPCPYTQPSSSMHGSLKVHAWLMVTARVQYHEYHVEQRSELNQWWKAGRVHLVSFIHTYHSALSYYIPCSLRPPWRPTRSLYVHTDLF